MIVAKYDSFCDKISYFLKSVICSSSICTKEKYGKDIAHCLLTFIFFVLGSSLINPFYETEGMEEEFSILLSNIGDEGGIVYWNYSKKEW